MVLVTFSGERGALMSVSRPNTHFFHPVLGTLVWGSARPFASVLPTTPLLCILCRRFFPAINSLPLPPLHNSGDQSLVAMVTRPPMRGVCVPVTPVACRRRCVCVACWLYLPLHPSERWRQASAGDAAAPPPRVAVTAVWSRSSHLTHSASSPGSCAVMTELHRRGMTKKARNCQACFVSLPLKKLTWTSIIETALKMLMGLEQRKLRFSCLSSPLSALAGTETESSSEVINLFSTLGANWFLKVFCVFVIRCLFLFGLLLILLLFHFISSSSSHTFTNLSFSTFFFASFVTSCTPTTSLSVPAAPCFWFLYLSEGNLFSGSEAITKSHHKTFKCKN